MPAIVALDTSCAVAYLVQAHDAHDGVSAAVGVRVPVLTAHSLAETYSVLTRLPGSSRLLPRDAARLIRAEFGDPALMTAEDIRDVATLLSELDIVGGAVYDALVALATRANDLTLLTRDRRALATYVAVGARVELVRS